MSRVAKKPIALPSNVMLTYEAPVLTLKGPKGELSLTIHSDVTFAQDEQILRVANRLTSKESVALAGTMRALIANMVLGVTEGFQKKLLLVGVGYRASLENAKTLLLNLGFSHPVQVALPDGISVSVADNQTEIAIMGIDKQKVGQFSAEIRALRPVEPYKGKGIRDANETVILKETKKK